MNKEKALKIYNATSNLIDIKFKEIDLIKHFIAGGRVSIKLGDSGKKFYDINTGYKKFYNKNYEYILQYGIIESELDDPNSFEVGLFKLETPFAPFGFNFGKISYLNLEEICNFIAINNLKYEKSEVHKDLETELKEKYIEKQVYVKDFDIYANISNVYDINGKTILGVESYEGWFLVDLNKVDILKDKKDLEYYEENNSQGFDR